MNIAVLLKGEIREDYRKRLNVRRYKDFNSEYFFNNSECRIIGIYDFFFKRIIGCVFFNPFDEEIGISVIAQMQGKHAGDYVLYHGLRWIKRYYPNAHVHAQCNAYSVDLLERNGFISDTFGEYYYDS